MERSWFIKKLIGAAGLSALPVSWVKVYDKFYLLQSFIAGFKFYEGPQLFEQLKEGDVLQLVREPENKYDREAIAVHWNERKIGFIPASLNPVFAKLIDINALELHAEITHLKPEARSWENVAVAIYCLKDRNMGEDLPPAAKNLMVHETPEYFSIKRSNNTISRIKQATGEEKVVVNIDKLPERYERLRKKYGAGEYRQEDIWFSENSYRILDDVDVEELLPAVEEVTDVVDTLNQHFSEIKFGLENCVAA